MEPKRIESVDAQGRIRHHRFGEGEDEQSEKIIQGLVAEAGIGGLGHGLVTVDARRAEADWGSLKSPENYAAANERRCST